MAAAGWRARLKVCVPRSRFGRNLLHVARANVLAQALPLLAAPLLTRLYAPSDFGELAVFTAVLGLLLAVSSGRFEWSAPHARGVRMAAAVLACGALMLAGVTLAIAMVAAGLMRSSAALAAGPGGVVLAAAWLLPLALLGSGTQQLLLAWHVRRAELTTVGRAKVAQSAATVVLSIAGASLGGWGLLAAGAASSWIGLRLLWRRAPDLASALRRQRRRTLAAALRRHGQEAAWSTLTSVLNAASLGMLPLLLARHYGVAEVGYFALMQRLAFAPIGLVAAALSQSFWAEAARLVRSDPRALAAMWQGATARLLLAAAALVLLALPAPLYVGPLFGDAQWAPAGWVLAASSPMLVGQLVVSPLSHLIVHGRQRAQALWDAARIVVVGATIETLGRAGADFALTVLAASSAMGLSYAVLWWMNRRALRAGIAAWGRGGA